jgi:[ribosomal protein S5]-alanine N-acetyltransferase
MRGIATPRLMLEPQLAEHAAEMFTLLNDPAIYRYENEAPPSVEWLRERFRRLESRVSGNGQEQWLNWVVRLPASGLIGFVQATVRSDGSAGIAYVLASTYWGRGFATEAVAAMLAELRERYGVHALSAVLKRNNGRSVRLLQGLGFAVDASDERGDEAMLDDELRMVRAAGEAA